MRVAISLVAARRILYDVSSSSEYLSEHQCKVLMRQNMLDSLVKILFLVIVGVSHFLVFIINTTTGIVLLDISLRHI